VFDCVCIEGAITHAVLAEYYATLCDWEKADSNSRLAGSVCRQLLERGEHLDLAAILLVQSLCFRAHLSDTTSKVSIFFVFVTRGFICFRERLFYCKGVMP